MRVLGPNVDPVVAVFAAYIVACILAGAWVIGCAAAQLIDRVWRAIRCR